MTHTMNGHVSNLYAKVINTDYLNALITDCENELNTLMLACEPFANTDTNKELLSKWKTFFYVHSTVSDIEQRKINLAKEKAELTKRTKETEEGFVHQMNELRTKFIQEDMRRSSNLHRRQTDNIQRLQEIRHRLVTAQPSAASHPHVPTPHADRVFNSAPNRAETNYLTQRNLLINLLSDIDAQIGRTPNQNQALKSAHIEARKVLKELDKQYPLRFDSQGLRHIPETALLHKLTTVCSRIAVGLQFVRHNGASMRCSPFYLPYQVEIEYNRAEHTRSMTALHIMAGTLKGHGLKKLGHFLIGFALLLLIITGILACIPSGGSSLLAVVGSFSGMHTLGVTALTTYDPS
ncbi:MAG: hypothetical protein NTU48_08925 [Legionellales bacterium]|nr:hypothetical protein [Legionellales bacterium]